MSSDGNKANGWEISDSGETYVRSVAQCGGYPVVDEILAHVEYHLSRNPKGFAKIPGYSTLWIAKTKFKSTASLQAVVHNRRETPEGVQALDRMVRTRRHGNSRQFMGR
jgi:hypothetical protein